MRILITGAGRAIGAATANVLSAAGHEVVATARDTALLAELDVAMRLELDVTDEASVDACLAEAGELDVIVNNAAIQGKAPLEAFPLDHLRAMFETNVIGPVRMVQKVLPQWRERGSGVIVNISSIQGKVATPLEGPYAATKFALEALSECLHYEVGHFGIRLVIVEPGYTAPGMKGTGMDLEYPSAYQGLYDQWDGTDDKVTGESGRPGPEVVGQAILAAIEDPASPMRVRVGEDTEMVLGARAALDDATFESTMRSVLGLTW
jgi:NAD(P)-dependent dehydrogenase (short-subunit alcohol dehydrogenase family)